MAGKHRKQRRVSVSKVAGAVTPVAVLAGTFLGTSSQASAATVQPGGVSVHPETFTVGTTRLTARVASQSPQVYTIQPGDSLSAIAGRFCGDPGKWPSLATANAGKIADPNVIYPGVNIDIVCDLAARAVTDAVVQHRADPPRSSGSAGVPATRASVTSFSGTLGCTGLEALWEAAGGPQQDAFMAAEIAMAESGGNQYALSPTNDYGYWQINGSHGPEMATFAPMGNADAAVAISDDGSNWDAWTTYTSGAYEGRC